MDSSVITLNPDDYNSEEDKNKYVQDVFEKQYNDERRATLVMVADKIKMFDLNYANDVLKEIKNIRKDKVWFSDEDKKIKMHRLRKLERNFSDLKKFLENKNVE